MAKKKNSETVHSPARSRSSVPRRAASPASPRRERAKAVDATADMRAVAHDAAPAPYSPSYDEIAEAAYHRYLRRGGQHGGAFDDWVEAERELRSRQSR